MPGDRVTSDQQVKDGKRYLGFGNESTVTVNFRNFGQRTRVKFKLHRGKEGWRIINVIYNDDSDLYKILSPP